MLTRAVVLLVAVLSLTGCQDEPPCTTCPALTGGYTASWVTNTAGTTCTTTTGPRPTTLNFSLVGAQASVDIAGVALTGTVFESWRIAVSGSAPTTVGADGGVSDFLHYSLQGTVIDATSDAPVRVVGTLSQQTNGCQTEDNLTADKT